MKYLAFSLLLLAQGSAPLPAPDASPAAYASAYSNYVPVAAPSHQYHAQDEVGQYNYGYHSGDSAKQEVKTADGVVRGSYSYVDANGIVQTVNYISDALGFRVAATNLPVHHVGEAAAEAAPASAPVVAPAPAVVQARITPNPAVNYAYLPYALGYNYNVVPTQYVHTAPAPAVVAAAPAPAASSQYHAQDELGQYSFGYNDPNSVRQEVKTADGVVRGAYRYVDGDGVVQTVQYIADAAGFRVAATNLPVHEVGPVEDTPEVAAVKANIAAEAAAEEAAVELVNLRTELEPAPAVQAAPVAYVQPAPVHEVVVHPAAPVVYTQPAPVVQAAPVVYSQPAPVVQAAPVAYVQPAPVVAAPVDSQYHAQDGLGQYSFGYSDGNSIKQELKTADGVVRGAYSYVDSDGLVQTVNYIADALGFRVGATNLPVHNIDAPAAAAPEAAAPVAAPLSAPVAAPVPATSYNHHHAVPALAPQVSYSYLPYASSYNYYVPASNTGAPVDAVNSQFHAQDEHGQYNYGYASPTQTKQEVKTADGVTRGSYSYVDANGIVQTVNYISDALGFRVAATNLPVHHVGEAAAEAAPAVAAGYSVVNPLMTNYAYLPYATGYNYHNLVAPVVPAVQEA